VTYPLSLFLDPGEHLPPELVEDDALQLLQLPHLQLYRVLARSQRPRKQTVITSFIAEYCDKDINIYMNQGKLSVPQKITISSRWQHELTNI